MDLYTAGLNSRVRCQLNGNTVTHKYKFNILILIIKDNKMRYFSNLFW
jgi:hypothetical protein